MVIAKTTVPIVDSFTGNLLLAAFTQGEVRGYEIDPGRRAYIPLDKAYTTQETRRLRILVDFGGIVYKLLYPEQVDFVTEHGLLKTLMEGAKITEVIPLTPAPVFISAVFRPFAVTLHLDNGLFVTLISDRSSGILNNELEVEESF